MSYFGYTSIDMRRCYSTIKLHECVTESVTMPRLCQGELINTTIGCCTKLANVVKTQPQCLYLVLDGGSWGINQTEALALPGACDLQTPPDAKVCHQYFF